MTRAGRMRVVVTAGSLAGAVVLACAGSASASASTSVQPAAGPCAGLTGTMLQRCTAAVNGCKAAAKTSPAAGRLCLSKVGQAFAQLRTTATVTMRLQHGGRLSFAALTVRAPSGSFASEVAQYKEGSGSSAVTRKLPKPKYHSVVITRNHDATSKRLQSLRLAHTRIPQTTITLSAGGASYLLLQALITRFTSSTKGRQIDVLVVTFEGLRTGR